ncbi:MAG: undecaprenyl-phosphate galactose phosphotransferase WbaP [Burkholderiales bacterium]|nr:undecaprenyl-phosphate galactose phosphotransferase WbaP [Burkholderiales bacterium]
MQIKNKTIIQKIALITSDLTALLITFLVARYVLNLINPNIEHITFKSVGIAKFGGLVVIIVFWYQEQYVKRRPTWEELALLYKTIFIFAILHMGLSFLISHHVIKIYNLLFWLILYFILPMFRYLTKTILHHLGLWTRNVYIIGTGKNAIAAANLLSHNRILGYKIVAFVSIDGKHSLIHELDAPVLKYDALLNHDANSIDSEIVVALSSTEIVHHLKKINVLQSHYAFVSIVPDIIGLPLYGVHVEHFFGSEQLFLRLQNNLGRRLNRTIKRITDIILSLVGLIILSPFILIISLIIIITTGQNAFFKHRRIGKNGEYFYCIKFQTMYRNGQEVLNQLLVKDPARRLEWEQDFKLKDDPRVTPIGKFLRKTSLDELPQLFNVLIGEMSLVGPRPIIDAEIVKYLDDFYYYKLVRPGITGLWQISGRNDIDYHKRVRLDVCYIKNWSLWYDFVILFKTISAVLWQNGAY